MNRRGFITTSAVAAAMTGVSGCKVEKIQKDEPSAKKAAISTLAGRSLSEIREEYRYWLMDDYIPFIYQYVYDHEKGGFMCNTDRDGTNNSTGKSAWYEGRGIWVHSFLYNKIEADPRHLEVARKSVDFIMGHRPKDDSFWISAYDRDGNPKSGPGDIYASLFIANGLAEYSKAAGNEEYWDIARQILLSCMKRYDRDDYDYAVYYGPSEKHEKPARVLGHWMVLIRMATQMLENRSDPEIEKLAGRFVDAIMKHHFNPDYGLMNEVMKHDLTRAEPPYDQFSYTGHAIETLWMLMYEAARKKDSALYNDTCDMFRRHVEVAWDDVYGGCFRCLDNVDAYTWKTDKVLWLQEEVLIGTLFMIEHSGDPWAVEWFDRMYNYVMDKFPLKQYGYSLWLLGGDRKVTFTPGKAGRVGNFHHPRHLMLNLLALDRIIKNGGAASGLFG